MTKISPSDQAAIHLRDAEAYFLMSQNESYIMPQLIEDGAYERRMWMELFKWAGWRDK